MALVLGVVSQNAKRVDCRPVYWATRSFSGIKPSGAKEFVGGTVMAEAAVSLEIPVLQ